MKVQRLRLTFSRGEEVKYISHLDLMRLWSRALRRAGLPIVYSEGFTPRPRLSLACPLAVGVTSQAELLDLYLARRISPYYLMKGLSLHLPQGIELLEAQEVALSLPSLQSLVRATEYRVRVASPLAPGEVQAALSRFLAMEELAWEHRRETEVRHYDLRALVEEVRLEGWQDGEVVLFMRLKVDEAGSGRPEQVAAALGLPPPKSIHRTRIVLAPPVPIRKGRPLGRRTS